MLQGSGSAERLIRALERGGCIARVGDGNWGVWRGQDLRGRCIGRMPDSLVRRLKSEGKLAQQGPGPRRFFWVRTPASEPLAPRIGSPPKPHHQKPRRAARPALDLVLASIPDPEVRAIARAAVQRFEGDAERAASGQRVTQNWDTSLHVDGAGSDRHDHGGRSLASQRAHRRLSRIEAALGVEARDLVVGLVIYRRSIAALARQAGLTRGQITERCRAALVLLAQAYGLMRSDRPA